MPHDLLEQSGQGALRGPVVPVDAVHESPEVPFLVQGFQPVMSAAALVGVVHPQNLNLDCWRFVRQILVLVLLLLLLALFLLRVLTIAG